MSEFASQYRRASRPIDRWSDPDAHNAWYARDFARESRRLPTAFGWLAVALLVLWTVWTTGYIIVQNDEGEGAREVEIRLRSTYETRITRLRSEIDSINGRLMLNQDAFDSKLEALRKRQKHLESRQVLLSELIEEANHPALQAAATILESDATGSLGAAKDTARELRLAFTPRPAIAETVARRQLTASTPGGGAFTQTASSGASNPADHALDRLSQAQDQLEASQHTTLAELEARAEAASRTYREILANLGVEPADITRSEHGARPDLVAAGMGGPFVPMVVGGDKPRDPFEGRISHVREMIFTSAELYDGLSQIPARVPITGKRQVTSGFGMRRDPFLGSMAMHSGLDFRARQGEQVMATADGEVSFAGRAGGYGNMVEITHANGLVSRYAHLSAIAVREGEKLNAGHVIGRVGSTGRSTGPHLHYELKLNDKPINPRRCLNAADLLAAAQSTTASD